MGEKIKVAIEKLIKKTEEAKTTQEALELSHAVLYLTQALQNTDGRDGLKR